VDQGFFSIHKGTKAGKMVKQDEQGLIQERKNSAKSEKDEAGREAG